MAAGLYAQNNSAVVTALCQEGLKTYYFFRSIGAGYV